VIKKRKKIDMTQFRRFISPSEVEFWVKQNYTNDDLSELSAKENIESTLCYYKGGASKFINSLIRQGCGDYMDMLDLSALQGQLMKYKIQERIVVYRFVDFKEFLILHKKTLFGQKYAYPEFLSTTLLKDQYSMDEIKHGRFVIELFIEKQTHGAYLPEVVRQNPEFEVLFPHHTYLKRLNWKRFYVYN
jgi:hypothetical protein